VQVLTSVQATRRGRLTPADLSSPSRAAIDGAQNLASGLTPIRCAVLASAQETPKSG